MSTMKSLLKWVELAAVVSAVIGITYIFGLPILLPRLWPEVRLPLALLAGSVVLILALMPDIGRRHPAGEGPTGHPESRVEPAATTSSASEMEAERHYEALLRRKTHGETDLMERLVAYERGRNPHATRAELLAAAVERWEHDNR
jgi:hypothetical protein